MVVVRAFGVQDLYEAAESEIIAILYHPFTLSSLTGTLPTSNLLSFLYDEAYILSAASSLSKQQQTKALLLKYVDNLHEEYEVQVSDSSKAMRGFMMDQAVESDCKAAVTLMAVLHIRVFFEKMISKYMPLDEKQSKWITIYGNPDFQACASLVEEDLETKLLQNMGTKGCVELQTVFKATLNHQKQILSSAYSGQQDVECMVQLVNPWHPANLLFTTDYDVTCTVKDTSEILVHVAQENGGSSNLEERYWSLMKVHDNRIKDCLSLWEYGSVSAKLTSISEEKNRSFQLIPGMDLELRPFIRNLQEEPVNSEISGKYENSNLRDILRKLGDLEKRINKDVMAAGVLRGGRRGEIRAEVRRIPLQSRCSEVLVQLTALKTPVHFISATWSRDLVLGGLPSLPKGLLFVHSNDLEYDCNGVSDGTFHGVVQDAFDKEAILQFLRRMYNAYPEHAPKSKPNKMAVFLGDSTNDLLALLNADLGIVMGQNPAFRQMLLTYNIKLLPLVVASAQITASIRAKSPKSFRHTGILFEASGWAEVEACLLSSNCSQIYDPLQTFYPPVAEK